jgi:Reverse transcriptase (RNA-dependent DNA polymerase)
MGLSVSPDIYQEKISSIFTNMDNLIVFFDDIAIITNNTLEDHVKVLDEALHRLKQKNQQVNGKKSHFCEVKAKFLGFVLTCNGVKPQISKVEVLMKLALPKTVKQVCSFIGMINYYKDNIPN